MKRETTVLVLGPDLAAMSGVSTHVGLLLDSELGRQFRMVHFQVGSEGRKEGPVARWMRLAVSPFALLAAILLARAAIVHVNTSMNVRAYWRDVAYVLVAKMCGAKVLYQVHGGEPPAKFFEGRPLLLRFLRLTLRAPDAIVVLGERELAAYREFVPGQNVKKVPNGIPCRPFEGVPTVRSHPDHPLRLVYIGRLAPEKGLYETLQALRLANELGVDTRLVIAGGGEELPKLRQYAQALGLSERVSFPGPVFGASKVKLFHGCDVFLLPSYSEGLPYALLESMAAGVPVLTTPVGAIPEVVADGTHGVLVPPRDAKAIANALAALGADRERLAWMSRACRRRVRAAFSIERVAAAFAGVYRELAAPGSARRGVAPILAGRK